MLFKFQIENVSRPQVLKMNMVLQLFKSLRYRHHLKMVKSPATEETLQIDLLVLSSKRPQISEKILAALLRQTKGKISPKFCPFNL